MIIHLLLISAATGFAPNQQLAFSRRDGNLAARMAESSSVVVLSPPGGIGEVAAVEAARRGSSVRWFVVSDESSASVSLSPQCLDQVSAACGSLELAGASVEDLIRGDEALIAASKWCGAANGLVCAYDGSDEGGNFKAAIRLAAQSVSRLVNGVQVAVLSSTDDLDEAIEESDGIAGALGSFFRDSPKVPPTLVQALSSNSCTLRHGELFGKPESSPDFSPLFGGPRREPIITEEYTMRGVRVDPFITSNPQASTALRTSRHAVGEAAALIATGAISLPKKAAWISSQTGSQKVSIEEWNEEFNRMQDAVAQGSSLFSQEMVVEDNGRLADWLATKWAPAVLRTYDIAAIRIGGRPVYAKRLDGSGIVEIVWQELVNFESRVVGRMIVEVSSSGIVAKRGPGDASDGFGSISMKALPGEEVLVNRLAEAAAQAVDKGLAKKVRSKVAPKVPKPAPVQVTSLESSGAVDIPVKQSMAETGPRKAGARRSTPRRRKTAGSNSTE